MNRLYLIFMRNENLWIMMFVPILSWINKQIILFVFYSSNSYSLRSRWNCQHDWKNDRSYDNTKWNEESKSNSSNFPLFIQSSKPLAIRSYLSQALSSGLVFSKPFIKRIRSFHFWGLTLRIQIWIWMLNFKFLSIKWCDLISWMMYLLAIFFNRCTGLVRIIIWIIDIVFFFFEFVTVTIFSITRFNITVLSISSHVFKI